VITNRCAAVVDNIVEHSHWLPVALLLRSMARPIVEQLSSPSIGPVVSLVIQDKYLPLRGQDRVRASSNVNSCQQSSAVSRPMHIKEYAISNEQFFVRFSERLTSTRELLVTVATSANAFTFIVQRYQFDNDRFERIERTCRDSRVILWHRQSHGHVRSPSLDFDVPVTLPVLSFLVKANN
jgi:hypothetical protein